MNRSGMICLSVVVSLSGCGLVEDQGATAAGGFRTTTTVADPLGSNRSASSAPDSRLPRVSVDSPPPEPPETITPSATTETIAPSGTPETIAPSATTILPEEYPPVCFHLRRFRDTTMEMLSLSTTPEVSERLGSLQRILSMVEVDGDARLADDAGALRSAFAGFASRLEPNDPVQETYQKFLAASADFAAVSDRLVAQGLDQCGGSVDPPLSTQDGIRLLTGIE